MSLYATARVYEIIHNRLIQTLKLNSSGGDLILAVAFSFLCGLLKRWCKKVNITLEYGELEKFHDVLYKSLVRTWLTYYSIALCLSKDYFWDTSLYFRYDDGSLRGNHCSRNITVDERIYYVALFGYYLNHTITQFNDPVRQDFLALFMHHVVTLMLIILSYKSGFSSVGVVLAMCHEPSDMLLSFAKIFRYLGMKNVTDILYVIFSFSWFYCRIYLYPLKCILSLGPWRFLIHDYLPIPSDKPPNCRFFLIIDFIVLLMVFLYMLHIYWTYFLIKSLIRKFTTGKTEDTRSDKELIRPAGGSCWRNRKKE